MSPAAEPADLAADSRGAKTRPVALSGITAALHIQSKTSQGRAVLGALIGLTALAALFLGVLLVG